MVLTIGVVLCEVTLKIGFVFRAANSWPRTAPRKCCEMYFAHCVLAYRCREVRPKQYEKYTKQKDDIHNDDGDDDDEEIFRPHRHWFN